MNDIRIETQKIPNQSFSSGSDRVWLAIGYFSRNNFDTIFSEKNLISPFFERKTQFYHIYLF
jgi:hypothetical protein